MSILEKLSLAFKSGQNVTSVQCQLPERARLIGKFTTYLGQKSPCSLWNLGMGQVIVDGQTVRVRSICRDSDWNDITEVQQA